MTEGNPSSTLRQESALGAAWRPRAWAAGPRQHGRGQPALRARLPHRDGYRSTRLSRIHSQGASEDYEFSRSSIDMRWRASPWPAPMSWDWVCVCSILYLCHGSIGNRKPASGIGPVDAAADDDDGYAGPRRNVWFDISAHAIPGTSHIDRPVSLPPRRIGGIRRSVSAEGKPDRDGSAGRHQLGFSP